MVHPLEMCCLYSMCFWGHRRAFCVIAACSSWLHVYFCIHITGIVIYIYIGIRYVSACVWIVGLGFSGAVSKKRSYAFYLPMLSIVKNHESILHVHWWEEVLQIITHEGGDHSGVNARCSCLPNAKLSLRNATFQTVFAYCHV